MNKIYLIFTFFFVVFALPLLAQRAAHRYEECPTCREAKSRAHSAWGAQRPNINYNSRSDSFDILHYDINISAVNFGNSSIGGSCEISARVLIAGQTQIRFDLLALRADSVRLSPLNTPLVFAANDSILTVQIPATTLGDTLKIKIFYGGQPRTDSSWGGFYFDNGYAFNLGVGFSADPHNFGRAWHPCFDNFVERATYRIAMTTSGSKRGHANGTLIGDIANGSLTSRTWELETPIPTYLACMAVADYTTVNQTYLSPVSGRLLPIELVAVQSDTTNFKASFQNLPFALAAFEYWFGAYNWEKVGFTAVPFSAGAMEHATSIAYPRYAFNNGATGLETLMAHELSHHWFGNWLTCETAEDMWINEGMASYCEHLFLERRYGWPRYIQEVKANHYSTLATAHTAEGGYRPISGVPHQYTYGRHVYDKGASVAHNLRWYLGDSLFRVGGQGLMQQFALTSINSATMRDSMSRSTGYNLTPFFEDWVFSGGYPHFEIDSVAYQPDGNGGYNANLRIRQKLVGRVDFHTQVPLALTFYNSNHSQNHYARVMVSGELDNITLNLPFLPAQALLNEQQQLNQARRDYSAVLFGNISQSLPYVYVPSFLVSNNATDSFRIHAEYHSVPPTVSRQNPNNYRISNTRYWSFYAWHNPAATVSFRLEPDIYLDADILAAGVDSLILLYRASPNEDWQEHPNYNKVQIGSLTYLRPNSLLSGDYAFGTGEMGLGINSRERTFLRTSRIFPNPAADNLQVELNLRRRANLKIVIVDTVGRVRKLQPLELTSGKHTESIDISKLPAGLYFVKIQDENGLSVDSHTLRKE
jgi:aminopeptidase N